jgi:hypothetical protein
MRVAARCPPDVIGDRVPWRRRCRSSKLDQKPLACRNRLYSDVCRVMTLESAPRGDGCRVLDHGFGCSTRFCFRYAGTIFRYAGSITAGKIRRAGHVKNVRFPRSTEAQMFRKPIFYIWASITEQSSRTIDDHAPAQVKPIAKSPQAARLMSQSARSNIHRSTKGLQRSSSTFPGRPTTSRNAHRMNATHGAIPRPSPPRNATPRRPQPPEEPGRIRFIARIMGLLSFAVFGALT